MSVKSDEGEAKFIKFVADVDEQVFHLLVDVAADACLLAVLIEGRLDDLWLFNISQVVVSYKFTNDGVGVDIDGEALGIVFFGVVNLHIDDIISWSYFQEAIQALVVSLNILAIIELISAIFGLFSF